MEKGSVDSIMRCPRCEQNFYQAAERCPHCDFEAADAQVRFGNDPVKLRKLTDTAGVFRVKDRARIRREVRRFERAFPQLFFAVYAQAFPDQTNIREFGFWLLNQGAFEDVDLERPNECGILLTIDANARRVTLTCGYVVMPYLDEVQSFRVLAEAHGSLVESRWSESVTTILKQLRKRLKAGVKEVRRDPVGVLGRVSQRPTVVDEAPKPVREGHVRTREIDHEGGLR